MNKIKELCKEIGWKHWCKISNYNNSCYEIVEGPTDEAIPCHPKFMSEIFPLEENRLEDLFLLLEKLLYNHKKPCYRTEFKKIPNQLYDYKCCVYVFDEMNTDSDETIFHSVSSSSFSDAFIQTLFKIQEIKNIPKTKDQRPKVVCLCGSALLYDKFKLANFQETMNGNIVLSICFAVDSQRIGFSDEEKIKLVELHKNKIDLADEILVVSEKRHIGDSTTLEIEYAFRHNKPVRYWEDEQ